MSHPIDSIRVVYGGKAPSLKMGEKTVPLLNLIREVRAKNGNECNVITLADAALAHFGVIPPAKEPVEGKMVANKRVAAFRGKLRSACSKVVAWSRKNGQNRDQMPTIVYGGMLAKVIGGSWLGYAGEKKILQKTDKNPLVPHIEPIGGELTELKAGQTVSIEWEESPEGVATGLILSASDGQKTGKFSVDVDAIRERIQDFNKSVVVWKLDRSRDENDNVDFSSDGSDGDDC